MASSYKLLESYKEGDFTTSELTEKINLHYEDWEEYKKWKNFNAENCLHKLISSENRGQGSWEKGPYGGGIRTYKALNNNNHLLCTCQEVVGIFDLYTKM